MDELVFCPYCKSSNTETFYNILMPNILSACNKDILRQVVVCELLLKVCCECALGFNACPPSDEQLHFIYNNYLYISPLNGIGSTKYHGMIETVSKWCQKKDRIVEIGCSEGYLLKKLKDMGYEQLLGIEPGPQEEIARAQGFQTIKKYYAKDIFEPHSVDIFLLMHVFEHFQNFEKTLEVMLIHLRPGGRIIIEVPDFMGFHVQHLFYYNLPFFVRLTQDKSLTISDWYIDQNALRVVLTRKKDDISPQKELTGDRHVIIERARKMQQNFNHKLKELKEFLLRSEKTVHWWGAGSVSVIYLNQLKKTYSRMGNIRVVDTDLGKQGCFIPGVGLEVYAMNILDDKELNHLVIASSLFNEIKAVMKENNISAKNIFILEN